MTVERAGSLEGTHRQTSSTRPKDRAQKNTTRVNRETLGAAPQQYKESRESTVVNHMQRKLTT